MEGACVEDQTEIRVDRYLEHPGRAPARRKVNLVAGKNLVSVEAGTGENNGLLALPAPVNAHDHGYGIRTLDFGLPDDALEPWIAGLRNRPATEPYLEALVAFGRLALNGCGATMHCHNSLRADRLADEVAEVAKAARDCGIRLALSCPLLDTAAWTYDGPNALRKHVDQSDWAIFETRRPRYAPVAEQIDAVSDIVRTQSGDMVDIQFGPIGPQWCSDTMLETIAEASERLNCRIHMHLLESPRQRRWLDERFKDGVVQHLDRIGFLSPRLAVAHGVKLKPDECDLLAERGVIVASNPSANLRLRSGIAPVEQFRKSGLKFAIGLDGTGFSDDQDIWQEMRLFRLLHGGNGIDQAVSDAEIFDAITGNGAEVLNQDVRGDLAIIRYGDLTADAMYDDVDEAAMLLTRMTGYFVRDLIVAGRKIVSDGQMTGFDFEDARSELVNQARAFAESAGSERAFTGKLARAIGDFYR